MNTFLFIMTNVMFPMAVLVATGYIVQRKFKLDQKTLSRFNLYVMIPALIFTRVYAAEFTWDFLGKVTLYSGLVMAGLYVLGMISSRILKLSPAKKMAFSNSLMFFNSGNYGLPVVDLAFHGNPVAVTGQLMIMLVQNIVGNSLGVYQAGRGQGGGKEALRRTLAMPSLYALILVFIVRGFGITVPEQVLLPMNQVADGFVGFALFTLGASLAGISASFRWRDAIFSSTIKLVLAPLMALPLTLLMGFEGILAQSLVIGMCTPTAVNTTIIAREMDNEPDYAAQLCFFSTLASPVTITIILLYLKSSGGG